MKKEIIEEINDGKVFLTKISVKDRDFVFNSLKDETVSKYLSLGPLVSREHSQKLINNYLTYWDKQIQFNYIIEIRDNNKSNEIKKVGSINLWNISWLHKRAEIGIWLNSKYWNQGIAKRALSLIINIGFYHLNLHRLEAHIAVENIPSINLFKKCGFIQEGILKDYLFLRGVYNDAVILSLINKS